MRLRALQRQLQDIYEINVDEDVDDFLITDPRLARTLDTSANPRAANEKLLLCQHEAELQLSVYIDSSVMAKLSDEDPVFSLSNRNITQYCIALEGVSHFLYLAWNAEFERSVTLMELELQAEVDKYIGVSQLLRRQNNVMSDGVHHWLFENFTFDGGLDASQLERYRDANHFAAKYCWRLRQRYLNRHQSPVLLSELRRFYRKTQSGKIRMINAQA